MKIDMHVHSFASIDGLNTPKSVRAAINKGRVDAVAITDHDNYSAWQTFEKEGIPIIRGVEKTVKEEDGNKFHLLAYFINEPLKGDTPEEIFDSVHEQGGICVIAHPYDRLRKAPRDPERYIRKVDGFEAFNARISAEYMNHKAKEVAKKYGKIMTGGGDAHHPTELGHGYIEVDSEDMEEIRKKLKKGDITYGGERSPIYVHILSYLKRIGILKPKF